MLAKMLRNVGVDVTEASNGQEALDCMATQSFDIVFMDIRMPVMDGLQALKQIKANPDWDHTVCVAVSASTLMHENRSFLEAGFLDFISKPFHFDRIYDCIQSLLNVEFALKKAPEQEVETLSLIPVPAAQVKRLIAAASDYEMSAVDETIEEIEQSGPQGKAFVQQLQGYIQNYNMEGMVKALRETHRYE